MGIGIKAICAGKDGNVVHAQLYSVYTQLDLDFTVNDKSCNKQGGKGRLVLREFKLRKEIA